MADGGDGETRWDVSRCGNVVVMFVSPSTILLTKAGYDNRPGIAV